jgi:hypothetical protein
MLTRNLKFGLIVCSLDTFHFIRWIPASIYKEQLQNYFELKNASC